MSLVQRLFILLLLWSAESQAQPRAVRVVSQTVGTDELLLAVAAPSQIAALSPLARDPQFCCSAAEAKGYASIAANGDAESVLRFDPTVVLCADYSRPELVTQLRRAGIRVLTFNHYVTLDDAYANLRLIGREVGAEAALRARYFGLSASRGRSCRLPSATFTS